MGLNRQIFVYSVGTDSFYTDDEEYIHGRLNRLYVLRSKGRHKKIINEMIKTEKNKLSEMLNKKAKTGLIRQLRQDKLKDKDVVSLFESSLTRALEIRTNSLTTDLFVVTTYFYQVLENLVNNGFEYNGEKYVFLTASAGQIRTKRSLFIKKSSYDKTFLRLHCGLTWDDINRNGGMNPNKYLAYLALNNSATDVWEDFDIDKAIVVDDFETAVPGLVDYIDSVEYKITRKMTETVIPHSDGWGMMDGYKTRMIRAPWVKGLLTNFPFNKWIAENCLNGKAEVYDIYGKKYILPDDGIKYILTKSQFKLAKYYASWEDYKGKFKKYNCEVCFCKLEEDFTPNARINYQELQTLSDITDSEISRLTAKTVEEIKGIGTNFKQTMKLLGAHEENKNQNNFQTALMLYPELLRDKYSQEVLKQTKKSYVKQAKAGKLRVNGKYLFLSPDPIAFCQWLFLGENEPDGCLNDGDIYCREYPADVDLACLRSPHLYREWAVRKNKRNSELDKWLSQTNCVYTSCHDLISRYLMFDCDGDTTLVINDKNLTKIAKRNMKDIVPLAYDLKKAKGGILSYSNLYEGMIASYGGSNIGVISNNISKIWGNSEKITDDELTAVKYLCYINNATIDYAKCLWLPKYTDKIKSLISDYTKKKLPHYFIYAKDKLPSQVEEENNSAMNRISVVIPNSRLKISKSICKFDYTMLINAIYPVIRNEEHDIIKKYIDCISHIGKLADLSTRKRIDDTYVAFRIRERLAECNIDVYTVANTLVWWLYIAKPSWTKKWLWACFGEEILSALRQNLVYHGRICPQCGNRFVPKMENQTYCSKDCFFLSRLEQKRAWANENRK